MPELIRTLPPEKLQNLCEPRASGCLSLYIPTEKAGPPVRQNVIRFKNQLAYAREQVDVRCPYPAEDAHTLITKLETLAHDEAFWRVQENGLALLTSADELIAIALPETVEPELYFGMSYHCKPLVRMTANPVFALFSLTQNGSELLEQQAGVALHPTLELTLPGGIRDILKSVESKDQLGWHSLEWGGNRRGPTAAAIFHGHGGGGADSAEQKQRILEYCRALDTSLTPVYRRLEQQQVPLIVAAVEYVYSLFREVCTYRYLWPECIAGNFEREKPEELRQRAEALLKPHFESERKLLHERIEESIDVDLGSSDPLLIAHAAQAGYIDTVIVAEDRTIPAEGSVAGGGMFSPKTGQDQKWDCDLLDYIVRHTILNGGSVKLSPAEQLPAGGSDSVALFRRPVAPEFFGLKQQREAAALELR